MSGIVSFASTGPRDPRWGYDDPSGLPDEVPVTLHLPEPLLDSVRTQAARAGTTPAGWVLDLVARAVHVSPAA